MARELVLLAFSGLLGFVVSGVLGSLYQLVTSRPPAFTLPSRTAVGALGAFLLFAMIGPFIIACAAWRRDIGGSRSLAVSAGGLAVAGLWSVCSGIFVASFIVSARNGLV